MNYNHYTDADGYSWTPYLVMACGHCEYGMPHLIRSDGQYVMCAWCKHVDEMHVDTYARRIS
jgi:hypothetical protein